MSVNEQHELNKKLHRCFNKSQGVTLVEMMIASALSVAILAGMLQLMEGTRITSRLNESLSSIHLTGHYSLDLLRTSIKYRGFEGCKRPVQLDPRQEGDINWSDGAEYTQSVAKDFPLDNVAQSSLRGYEIDADGSWSPTPDADMVVLRDSGSPTPRPNSDVISLYYTSTDAVNLNVDMSSYDDSVDLSDDTLTFEQGDFVYVGDCTHSNIFAVSNTPSSSMPITLEHADTYNTSANLNYMFETTSEIRAVNIVTYYIGDTGRKTEAGDEVYALYRFENGASTEIVEGIENMQIVYGEELSTGNIRYLSADNADLNMRTVNSIRLGLLVYHHGSVTSAQDARTYNLVGTDIVPSSSGLAPSVVTHMGGGYLRKVFTESISLINRS